VVIQGSVRGQGELWIAGEVEGPVEIEGRVVIEPTGVVRGEVRGRAVVVAGVLEGDATAIELVRLEPGARMVGDARAERVSAAAGALLKGRIRTAQDRAQLERMRRTAGGTLLAPFSSSGTLQAPADVSGSVGPERAGDASPPVVAREPGRAPNDTGWEQAGAAAMRAPSVEVAKTNVVEARPARPVVERVPVPVPARAALPAARPREDDRPPPPVIPALGRRRAQRREPGGAP
jgi:cytoskeletal protein CcmA (bactofilin family)